MNDFIWLARSEPSHGPHVRYRIKGYGPTAIAVHEDLRALVPEGCDGYDPFSMKLDPKYPFLEHDGDFPWIFWKFKYLEDEMHFFNKWESVILKSEAEIKKFLAS